MKKKNMIITVIILLLSIILSIVGCAERKYELPNASEFNMTFAELEQVKDKSAYEMFIEAYNVYKQNSTHMYKSSFDFTATIMGGMVVATQQRSDVKKVDGNKIYYNSVCVGTDQGKENDATKFYYDGASAYSIVIDNNATVVPGKGIGEELFEVTDYGKFVPYNGNASDKIKTLKERICFYDFSKKMYLDDSHDDNVYTKDNKFYLTITFDCSKVAMDSFNVAARDEFVRALGMEAKDIGTFKITSPTTFQFIIGEVDGVNQILGMKLTEMYKGVKGFEATASQSETFIFSYKSEDYKINNNDVARHMN